MNPDNTLNATGTLKFRITLDADGDSFSGRGTFKFVDSKGNVLASGTEDLKGKRIRLEGRMPFRIHDHPGV